MKKLTLLLAALASLAQVAKAAPANDNFANAQLLTGTFPTATATLNGASREVGEPSTDGPQTVWFKWTSPAYGKADFGALFQDEYTSRWVRVYVGTDLNTLVEIDTNKDTNEPRTSTLVGKDITYFIRIAPNSWSDSADFTAFVDLDSAGYEQSYFQKTTWLNDNFSQAATLTGVKAKAIGYPMAATREAGEPEDTGYHTLWWKWVAPSTGTTIFSTTGSDADDFYQHLLTVAAGNQVSDLSYVSKRGLVVEIALKTVKGQTYYIAAGGGRTYSEDDAFLVSVNHTIEAATSTGSGTGGRFSTLRRDVLDYTTISGVFTISGLTGMKIVVPAGFYVRSGSFHPTAKKWSFILDKTSSSVSPTSCKVDIYCYKAGKQVGKFTKTFRVW